MERSIGAAGVIGNGASPYIAKAKVKLLGRITLTRIEHEQAAAALTRRLFDCAHRCAPPITIAIRAVHQATPLASSCARLFRSKAAGTRPIRHCRRRPAASPPVQG